MDNETSGAAGGETVAGVSGGELIAYRMRKGEAWDITPATLNRDWMDKTFNKVAYRCLPMVLANQAGWIITCPATFKAKWASRSNSIESLTITFSSEDDRKRYGKSIKSNFGLGIITFGVPYLFRTPPGIGLWAHGPANLPRPEVIPLEGLIETDWSPWPFTMNWKVTKPKVDVWFKKGDPICLITPVQLGLVETLQPRIVDIEDDQELYDNFIKASEMRMTSSVKKAPEEGEWELTYTQGRRPDGVKAPSHRSRYNLRQFENPDAT